MALLLARYEFIADTLLNRVPRILMYCYTVYVRIVKVISDHGSTPASRSSATK